MNTRLVALAGNPNVGKTTLFNQLTGLRQKVGNYPGVTVERKVGRMPVGDDFVEIVDVPGTYSLNPRSLDEEIAYRVLIGAMEGQAAPDLIVCVIDASNLERNLYLVSQVLDLGRPTVVALNMVDAAEGAGLPVDAALLSQELGVPVVPVVGHTGEGIEQLREVVAGPLPTLPKRRWNLDGRVEDALAPLIRALGQELPDLSEAERFSDALRALTTQRAASFEEHHSPQFWQLVETAREDLRQHGVAFQQAEVIARYNWITPLGQRVLGDAEAVARTSLSERLDAVLVHRIAGPLIFVAILALVFQAVFAWASPLMDLIEGSLGGLGEIVATRLPEGAVRDLLVDGIIAGVGSVLVFLPQILILFFFLGLLEDTGYMSRAAFIMDRAMKRIGLSGRSVVPLLSSFACAIPGIMATRTIDNQRDRLVTILVAPLMTCSARLPVYALLIGAFVPEGRWLGLFNYQGLVLLLLYFLGIVFAVVAAAVIRRFLAKGKGSIFFMELPPYRRPRIKDVLWRMIERSRIFVVRAGTIIMAISIVLWFLASYPALDEPPVPTDASSIGTSSDDLERTALAHSFIGRMGKVIEPVLEPLGFDWKIGVAVLVSFAAREVVVSALATIYNVEDDDEVSTSLQDRLKADINPRTGEPTFTPLVAASLMIFYVIALQCMSTIAIARRETNSWRWPAFMLIYMTSLAYISSLAVFQGGKLMGWT